MLIRAKNFLGRPVEAKDGRIGEIQGFYFDDYQWNLRYFMVEMPGRVKRKRFIISPASFREYSREEGSIKTDLALDQVRNSPEIEFGRLLSIDHEELIADYYGWPAYWNTVAVQSGHYNQTDAGTKTVILARRSIYHNLRRMDDIAGYAVEAIDGAVGKVEDFIVDDRAWQVHYLVVDGGLHLESKIVLLSPDWIENIEWDQARMRSAISCDTLKGSPEFEADAPVTREYEDRLHEYYGLTKYWDKRIES